MDGLFYFNVVCKSVVFAKLVCELEVSSATSNLELQTRN